MVKVTDPVAKLAFSACIGWTLVLSAAVSATNGEQQQAGAEQPASEHHLSSNKLAGVIYSDDMIGKPIKHRRSEETIGRIQSLIIRDDGRTVGVLLMTGSFLGLGGKNIALAWDALEHSTLERGVEDEESVIYVDIDEDALRDAPEYKRD